MSDFVILFGERPDADAVASMLVDRPGLERRPARTWRFPWGAVVAQPPANPGYEPLHEHASLWTSAGRPYLTGEAPDRPAGSDCLKLISQRWNELTPARLADRLSGMYALARCDDRGVEILTDQMGFRPVYVGTGTDGRIAAIGTFSEAVAVAAGRGTDFDHASLAELLVDLYITFPHTSRRGMHELAPASIHRVSIDERGLAHVGSEELWRPVEDLFDASDDELAERLVACMRQAGDDITRGLDRVALTLSGGWDSRAVLTALPRDRGVSAITFATRENRELETARRVAEAWGVPHHVAWRDPEFFVDLLERGTAIVGIEIRANAHGLCIVDSGLDTMFDVIIGGQLSDTFLKDHFMPAAQKESLRSKRPWEPLSNLMRRAGVLPAKRRRPVGRTREHTIAAIRPDVWASVLQRQRESMRVMRAMRPQTADEWVKFWPTSRQHDAGHNLANSRLYASDGLFMHREVVGFARGMSPEHRYDGRLSAAAFMRLYGELSSINISNDDTRPGERSRGKPSGRLPVSDKPWVDVQGSWADFAMLQKVAPKWQGYRDRLAHAPSAELLAPIMRSRPDEMIGQYQEPLGIAFNWTLMQLAYRFEQLTHLADGAPQGAGAR